MRRMWPDEFRFIFDEAEEVTLDSPATEREDGSAGEAIHRKALKVRLTQEDYERIWPFAEARHRLQGKFAGKAVTVIVNNPHYGQWPPADGGTVENVSESGRPYSTKYVVVYFLLDDVSETVSA